MKKFFSTSLAVILCTALLTGCGNNNIAETISETSVVSEETTTISETSAASETAETTTVPETSEISETAETEVTEETAETKRVPEMPQFEKLDMSGYTGNFYEWEYDFGIVAYDRESFAGGEDIIGAAERVVAENFEYTIYDKTYTYSKNYTYNEMAALAEKAEKSDKYGGCYIFEIDGESFFIDDEVFEFFLDEDGKLVPRFAEGAYGDFDGDGKNESFVCFGLVNVGGLGGSMHMCVAFVDEEGNAELIPRADGEIYDEGTTLYPMRYNGFWHMCTAFGVNIATHHSEIYAVENGKPVHKKTSFMPVNPLCGAFTLESAAQAPGSWISVWNEDEKGYFTLGDEDLTEGEINELFNSAAFKEDKSLTELYENAEQLKNFCGVTGKKYYNISLGGMWVESFVRTSGGFEKYEYAIIFPYHENGVYATGIDINKAEAEMVRLEK